jgi:hypothetical protein
VASKFNRHSSWESIAPDVLKISPINLKFLEVNRKDCIINWGKMRLGSKVWVFYGQLFACVAVLVAYLNIHLPYHWAIRTLRRRFAEVVTHQVAKFRVLMPGNSSSSAGLVGGASNICVYCLELIDHPFRRQLFFEFALGGF